MAIAFFDLDKTLLGMNSGQLWVRSEVRRGYITRWQALRAFVGITRYHLGFADIEELLLESIGTLAGGLESVIRQRTLEFYDREVRGGFRPGGLEALRRHRAAGQACVLLTSSSNYLSDAASAELQLDGVLCNRFEVDAGGRFTGKPLGTVCFGKGKVEVARRFVEARQVELRDCWFYSDSASDLPMLEAVGHPVAVHPDPWLRRVARKRGWSVADWGQAANGR